MTLEGCPSKGCYCIKAKVLEFDALDHPWSSLGKKGFVVVVVIRADLEVLTPNILRYELIVG